MRRRRVDAERRPGGDRVELRAAGAAPVGAVSARAYRAPGRVNLIGDHTDYNEGFVLPLAIQLECVVRADPRSDAVVSLRSLDVGDDEAEVELPADGSAEPLEVSPAWGRYAA
ncbi:MAG: hypothetical protein H0V40_11705, partial [Actinobacteria bacterium]|nr:hypothetical protein [Actinomycetota bacterium]